LRPRAAHVVAAAFAVAIVAQACAQFSSGECTDKATCDPNAEASTQDNTKPDAPVDVNIDTFVGIDGNVPDGECNGGAEDCANGKDDNCNGLVDCADPVCQGAGYVCTDPVPTGWIGPVAWVNIAGGTLPSCGGAYATQAAGGHDALTASPATCACNCGNPANVQCGSVSINYYTDGFCQSSYGSGGLPPNNFCVNTGGSSVQTAKGIATATSYNGDCTAAPTKTVPPVDWGQSEVVCNYDAPSDTGGCTSGLCVQSPQTGAWGKACIYQTGDLACPSGAYAKKVTFYTSVSDSRSCGTCTCTATPGSCNATISVFSNAGCGTLLTTIPTDGTCHNAAAAISAETMTITPTPGTCGSNGTGGPTGSASAAAPVTVCCPL
jgi:hypothetical protein